MSRAKANHLSVEISEIKNFNNDSTVYVSFSLMDGDVYVTVINCIFILEFCRMLSGRLKILSIDSISDDS